MGVDHPEDRPVYIISVAAELVGMHPQTLRLYEKLGLIKPHRQPGQGQGKTRRERETRLYSARDVERLLYIKHLTQELKVNLEGVKHITELQLQLDRQQQDLEMHKLRLQREIDLLSVQLDHLQAQAPPSQG
ncbi:MerR family transcriptional regulator [Candidatus Cyanaurora vandensis]|uniref:MerR family transcriptional regulator n=1 Tax=Candidatus Cyanaurora vandensis TaxID=2714958 RepID=UPI00257CF4F4|nr:MerR family transcriptional regulator [Candidatus Cyanaurora vandensis]